MSKIFIKLSTILISLVIICFSSQPVLASPGSFFNGGYYTVNNRGSAATIETQNPYISSNGSSSAWIMSCDPSHGQCYTQSGWAKDAGFSAPRYFCEYSSDITLAWDIVFLGTAATGSNNDFEVSWDSTTAYMRINGYDYFSVPISTLQWYPTEVQLLGETHDTLDQCPGSSGNHISVGKTYYKTTGGVWISNPPFNQTHSLTTMSNTLTDGSSAWDIWDNRY